MFNGRQNNDMLRCIMTLKGMFPKKMLKKGEFVDEHFTDAPFQFKCKEIDPVTEKEVTRLKNFSQPLKDLRSAHPLLLVIQPASVQAQLSVLIC